ncbi:MAG: OmpH family outer membrane protein [Deltaproteobacteria bacterium]|nr:MAG: OmpH family outer membrane protein [Deltaproteobacteria bacterium]
MKRNLIVVAIALTWLVLTGFKDASVEEIKTLTETFAGSYIKDFLKIAYVDLEEAVITVPQVKEMMENLDGWLKEKQAVINEKEKRIKEIEEMYKKQEMILSDSAKEQKRKEFQEELQEYQKVAMKFDDELGVKKKALRDLQFATVEKMKGVVKEMGSTEKYILILQQPKGSILYSTDNVVDITSKVVELYNKRYSRSKGSKK